MTTLTPIGGDPVALASKARGLRSSAELIQDAINDLNKLANKDETVSEAVDKLRSKATDLAGNITKAQIRFKGTADALLEYAGHLQTAQSAANAAISEYNTATSHSSGAQTAFEHQSAQWAQENSAHYYPGMPDFLNGYTQTPEGAQALHSLHAASTAVSSAETKWQNAVNDLNAAAKVAISKIDDAMNESGLKDGFWDKVGAEWDSFVAWSKKYLAPILDVLQKIAAVIGQIAGILSLIVGILAIFIPVLAPIAAALKVISLVASLVSFGLTLILFGLGDRTLGDVIGTGIGAALAVFGAKFPESTVGAKLGDKIGTTVAGKVAVFAESKGATYAEQAVIADATSKVADVVVDHAVDNLQDGVIENITAGVDAVTGQERPDDLWQGPGHMEPSIVPNIVEGKWDMGFNHEVDIPVQLHATVGESKGEEGKGGEGE